MCPGQCYRQRWRSSLLWFNLGGSGCLPYSLEIEPLEIHFSVQCLPYCENENSWEICNTFKSHMFLVLYYEWTDCFSHVMAHDLWGLILEGDTKGQGWAHKLIRRTLAGGARQHSECVMHVGVTGRTSHGSEDMRCLSEEKAKVIDQRDEKTLWGKKRCTHSRTHVGITKPAGAQVLHQNIPFQT